MFTLISSRYKVCYAVSVYNTMHTHSSHHHPLISHVKPLNSVVTVDGGMNESLSVH